MIRKGRLTMKFRRLYVLALALALSITAITGGTIAWFTDEVTSSANKIEAGKLDVDVLYTNADGQSVSIATADKLFSKVKTWEPGAMAYENLQVVNKGSLALQYDMTVNFGNENFVKESAAATEGPKLSGALKVAFVEGSIEDSAKREDVLDKVSKWFSLTEAALNAQGVLYAEGTAGQASLKEYAMVVYWQPGENDNDWNVHNGKTTSDGQPLHIDLGVKLIATQKDFEKDAFGDDYDADVQAVARVGTLQDLQAAIERNCPYITLTDDIVIDNADDFMFTGSNGAPLYFYHKNITLDLNGHDIIVEDGALMPDKTHANGVVLVRYSTLNIVGEGNIVAKNKSIPVYGWAHSEINIYGGNFITNAGDRNESAVYVNNDTVTIHVYGGNYLDSAYAFNAHDTSANAPVLILHEGVTFKQFLKNGTTDVIQSDLNKGRIVPADGCELTQTTDEDGNILFGVVKKQ